MLSQAQYDTTLQPVRDLEIKVNVLDGNFEIIDEISGIVKDMSYHIDSSSDIRRTADVSMVLKQPFSNERTQSSEYWRAGNPYWFNKYIQIEIGIKSLKTNKVVWINEGYYTIDSPSISYDSEENELSFQASDLMSKLTGQRDGNLGGVAYQIPFGSKITDVMASLLEDRGFFKYILLDPPQPTTPYDINVDANGSVYDILSELDKINANWEMFFDVDGTFRYQPIPSGQIENSLNSSSKTEPTPLVDNTIWDKLAIGHDLSTDFNTVKNYIEVLGKTHSPNIWADSVEEVQNILNLTVNVTYESMITQGDGSSVLGFHLNIQETGNEPILKENSIFGINVIFKDQTINLNIATRPIKYDNIDYVILIEKDKKLTYLGYIQPHSVAFDDNPNSPFYVGDVMDFKCSNGNKVNFISQNVNVLSHLDNIIEEDHFSVVKLNATPFISQEDFDKASVGQSWFFTTNIKKINNINIDTITVQYGNQISQTNQIFADFKQRDIITLDVDGKYLIEVKKESVSSIEVAVAYFPIKAYNFKNPTSEYWNLPNFPYKSSQTCVGEEYDNIYSNELTEERASYEIYLKSRLNDTIDITTVPIYWLNVNQIISFKLPNTLDDKDALWLVKSIDTEGSVEGTQSITAMRYYPTYKPIQTVWLVDSNKEQLLSSEKYKLSVPE